MVNIFPNSIQLVVTTRDFSKVKKDEEISKIPQPVPHDTYSDSPVSSSPRAEPLHTVPRQRILGV
jgi:hypothetical protein